VGCDGASDPRHTDLQQDGDMMHYLVNLLNGQTFLSRVG
jgi:hypothetical protein